MTHNKIFKYGTISLAIISFMALTGLGCKSTQETVTKEASQAVTLTYWRTYDDQSAFNDLIKKYQQNHKNVTIRYRKLRPEEYELELLKAWAEDRGPDIFSVPNNEVVKYQSKILAVPETLSVPYITVKGEGFNQEKIVTIKKTAGMTIKRLKDNFVDVVGKDSVVDNKIYGLPLSVDSLVMYYNKDMFNAAGLPIPPATWKDFVTAVPKLTITNRKGEILQSGAALGGTQNIIRQFDILSALMIQNGSVMNVGSRAVFNQVPASLAGGQYHPGVEALRFYTDFANPTKEVYSWNDSFPDSLTAFTSNRTAVFFGYAYHLPLIRLASPSLNLGIAPFPQIEESPKAATAASYWLETVSKKTKNPDVAWDFVQFITSIENVPSYLKAAKKPAALRSLLSSQAEDVDMSPFASQTLNAVSWYQGYDFAGAEKAFNDMVAMSVNPAPRQKPEDPLNLAAGRISQTLAVPKQP
ncbi:MAG: extracellular solute-binding protein [bacterium]